MQGKSLYCSLYGHRVSYCLTVANSMFQSKFSVLQEHSDKPLHLLFTQSSLLTGYEKRIVRFEIIFMVTLNVTFFWNVIFWGDMLPSIFRGDSGNMFLQNIGRYRLHGVTLQKTVIFKSNGYSILPQHLHISDNNNQLQFQSC